MVMAEADADDLEDGQQVAPPVVPASNRTIASLMSDSRSPFHAFITRTVMIAVVSCAGPLSEVRVRVRVEAGGGDDFLSEACMLPSSDGSTDA